MDKARDEKKEQEKDDVTFFYDMEGGVLGSDTILFPVALYKGMVMTFGTRPGAAFEVVKWEYHHGHPYEERGLRITLSPLR